MLHQTKMLECRIYASQTKILEGWTKDVMRIFEPLFKGASTLFGLRFREIYPSQTKILEGRTNILPLPNEDFGRPDKHFRARFRITFQGCEYPILARKSWKVLRKRALKCLSGLPKSSFGEHKIKNYLVYKKYHQLYPKLEVCHLLIASYRYK